MKKLIIAFLALFTLFMSTGCANDATAKKPQSDTGIETTQSEKGEKPSSTEKPSGTEKSDEKEITTMYVYVGDNKLEITLAKNSSVDALVQILKKGDIVYTADDYGNFEKVGNIGCTLPTNDEQINTQAGDVILYQGSNICLYYGTNSWSFTRLGKINGYSANELRTLLGAGSGTVQVKLSLK